MILRVDVDKRFMECCGQSSLSGALILFGANIYHDCTEIRLEFPQTSIGWRREHGGPEEWIMPEFAVPLLLQNVLELQEQGFKISVKMVEQPE